MSENWTQRGGLDKAQLDTASTEVTKASGALTAEAVSGTTASATAELHGSSRPDQPVEMYTKTLADTQWLIAAAPKWGWIRAGREASEFPHPIVTWDRDGAKIDGTWTVRPDSISYAPGSYTDPNTGQPNRSARSVSLGEVHPLRPSDQ